jgi:hypothetical protein
MRRWYRPVFHPRFRPVMRPRPWLGFGWRRRLGWGWWGLPLAGVLACLAVMALPMVIRLLAW